VRPPLRVILPALALSLPLAWAAEGRADVPDSRFGLLPTVGAGVAGLTTPGSLPGFIGFTTLGGELFFQLRRWGFFAAFNFLSSGNGGHWTAYEGTGGVSYRLFGGSDSFALFARGGLVYQHWVGDVTGGCNIFLFVPNSCVTEGEVSQSANGDAVGVSAGVRLEMPFRSFYLAVGSSFVPVVTINEWPATPPIDSLEPGGVFQFRFDIAVGFRDNRASHAAVHDPNEHHRSVQ
jgi:hypothetical protein